jgi:hypothetical protein
MIIKIVDELARETALSEWKEQKTRYLTCGYLRGGSVLNMSSGFYYQFYSSYQDERDAIFCDAYNNQVKKITETDGLPEWAPIQRLPTRDDAMKSAKELIVSDLNEFNFKVKKMIGYIVRQSACSNYIICQNTTLNILIIAQLVKDRLGQIDIVDLNGLFWMASYQYMNKKHPEFPFDRILVDGQSTHSDSCN